MTRNLTRSLFDLDPDLLYILLRKLHLQSRDILLHILNLLCARNRNNILTLRRQPCERQLARRAALLIREGLEAVDQHQVLTEIFRAEAGGDATEVVGRKVVGTLDLARQKAAAERRVCEDGDAELAAGSEQVRARFRLDV